MDSNTIGRRIKKLRVDAKQNQSDIAKALHVKRQTVDQWEAGTRDLKTQYTIALAAHFGVTCDEILTGARAENVEVHRDLGLTDPAIANLRALYRSGQSEIACEIISNGHFLAAIGYLEDMSRKAALFSDAYILIKPSDINGFESGESVEMGIVDGATAGKILIGTAKANISKAIDYVMSKYRTREVLRDGEHNQANR